MAQTSRFWRCGDFDFTLDRALVMGVLNVTPDSFSDGGRFETDEDAIAAGLSMAADGADIVDVGGESTRPGASEVGLEEELDRVVPVVRGVAGGAEVPVSIDTRHAEVARVCIDAGASIVNDVSGFRDEAMIEAVRGCQAGCVIMHMLGDPKTMQTEPRYDDVVAEVGGYLVAQARALEEAGVARERIAIDPGIGFGKTLEHNVELLGRLPELVTLGYPVVIGASRKSFIGALLGIEDPRCRIDGSIAVAALAARDGAAVVRTHDVRPTLDAVRMARALRRE